MTYAIRFFKKDNDMGNDSSVNSGPLLESSEYELVK